MMTDPENGKATGVLVFASYSYNCGEYHFSLTISINYLSTENDYSYLDILKEKK